MQVINKMFINFKTFKIHARRVFKNINAERTNKSWIKESNFNIYNLVLKSII